MFVAHGKYSTGLPRGTIYLVVIYCKKTQEEKLDSLASIIYIGVTDTLSRCISGDGTRGIIGFVIAVVVVSLCDFFMSEHRKQKEK